jgi:hypothetical protein
MAATKIMTLQKQGKIGKPQKAAGQKSETKVQKPKSRPMKVK